MPEELQTRVTRRTAAALFAAAAPGWALKSSASAQGFRSRQIRLIVPFSAGSPVDVMARLLSDKLGESMQVGFVVENRPGAGGNVGAEGIARAEPDGYTFGLTLDTVITANPWLYRSMRFKPMNDFSMIAAVAESGQMLVVHPSLPVATVDELVEQARATAAAGRPLIYGSGGGTGTPGHLTMESFRQRAGFDAVHLPFRANPAMVLALLTGEIKLGFVTSASVIDHVRDGKLRALGVSHATRAVLAPEVPTLSELGFPDFRVRFAQVLIAPKDLPVSLQEKMQEHLKEAAQQPAIVEKLRLMDITPVYWTGEQLLETLRERNEHWAKVAAAMPDRL